MKTTAPAVLLPADIGFAMSVDSWLSKAIAWFMGSRWSHTFMVAGSMHGQDMTVETSDYEVYAAPMIDHYGPRKRTAIYRCKVLDDETRKAIVLKSMSHIGETYGYLQLLSLGLRRLLMRAGIKIPNFIRQGLVCCAVPLYGYKEAYFVSLSTIDPESIDTEELYQLVSTSPQFELIYEQDP